MGAALAMRTSSNGPCIERRPIDAKKMLLSLREAVKRAWQTLATVRDPDLKFFNRGSWLFGVIRDVNQAYGYSSASARAFQPTAEDISRMEIVMGWMAWVRRREGETSIRRIIGWSMGVPLWQISRRERCSERTVVNRIDRSLNEILKAFGDLDAEPPVVEETVSYVGPIRSFVGERPQMGASAVLEPGRVWIDGIGWMFKGEKWDDGASVLRKVRGG